MMPSLMAAAVAATAVSVLAASANASTTPSSSASSDAVCRMWMAPSYLSRDEAVKYGLYAGVPFQEKDLLPTAEIAIPLIDFVVSPNRNRSPTASRTIDKVEANLWTAEYAAEAKFESNHSTALFVGGIGSLTNYHTGIANVEWYTPSSIFRRDDVPGLTQVTTPGQPSLSRGAISSYHNVTMRATQPIAAGMELFANYGSQYDDHFGNSIPTEDTDLYQNTITRWDYQKADELMHTIIAFLDNYTQHLIHEDDPTREEDVLDFILDKMLGGVAGKHAKVVRQLLPSSPRKLRQVQKIGGTFNFRHADMIRSQAWLQKHGVCVDQIRPGVSTIPEAGRGAFSTRAIAQGDIIVPVPLLLIAFEEVLDMYAIVPDNSATTGGKRKKGKQIKYDLEQRKGKQLLFNYAYGHQESSILLVPTGPLVTLINHAPSTVSTNLTSSTALTANAALVWSNHTYMPNNDYLFDIAPEELGMKDSPNLIMAIVALRDIAPDEEILIDYGKEWELAFAKYQKKFREHFPNNTTAWPLSHMDLRLKYQIPSILAPDVVVEPYPVVSREDAVNTEFSPYPMGVTTGCFLMTADLEDGVPVESEETGYYQNRWIGPVEPDDYHGTNFYTCEIIHRIDATSTGHFYNYTVLARPAKSEPKLHIAQVPHAAITLIPTAYSTDTHNYPHTFRQWINIPDHLFPQMWRNFR